MRKNHSSVANNPVVVGGLLAGTAIGAIAAFLYTTEKGREVRDNISSSCQHLSDCAQDIADQVSRKSSDLSDQLFGRRRNSSQINWIIGGVGASVLGVSALAYLLHDSNKGVRSDILENIQRLTAKTYQLADNIEDTAHDVAETFEEKVTFWVKTAQKFIDQLNGCAKTAVQATNSKIEDSTIDKVVDWASFGIKLYQSLKK